MCPAVKNALRTWQPLPEETLTLWVKEAEQHGFEALFPLINKESKDVVNRTLGYYSDVDWLFLVGIKGWQRALLIGADLGAAVEVLKNVFRELVVVEPNPLLFRLLKIRFHKEIEEGRVHLKEGELDPTDVELDLVWFMPWIARSQGTLPLTEEVRTLLRDCTTRLSPGGLLVAKAIRDRGLLRSIPLPGIRYEPSHGYSLREFEQVFRSISSEAEGILRFYWLSLHPNNRSCGVDLRCLKAISYCIRTSSRWFRFMGPLSNLGINFVAKRVSSVMLAFRRSVDVSSPWQPLREKGSVKGRDDCTLQRVMRTVKEQYKDCRELTALLYKSGNGRRDCRAMYLLIDTASSRPIYIVRIAKNPESDWSLRQESLSYWTLRQTNQALKNLTPMHYVMSDNTAAAWTSDASSNKYDYRGGSFSIESFVERVSDAVFTRQKSLFDTYSLYWINWFQNESSTIENGTFDNQELLSELKVVYSLILKRADKFLAFHIKCSSLPHRISGKILQPLIADLEFRFNNLEPFNLPFTAVHGDFCQENIRFYHNNEDSKVVISPRRTVSEQGKSAPIWCSDKLGLHVFDWEFLKEQGIPLFDPWLYIIGFVYLDFKPQVNRKAIFEFLTGRSKNSGRVEQCLSYYAKMSKIPVDLLVAYLPMALLIMYSRETHLETRHLAFVQLLEETIASLVRNRRQVWQYLDTLTGRLRKDIQK